MICRFGVFAIGFALMSAGCEESQPTSEDEAAFQRSWAAGWCDRQAECAQADYDAQWQDNAECIDTKSTDAEFNSAWGDAVCGDFSKDNTPACLDAMASTDCADWANDEWRNECGLVYGC